jgi:hypothetical protein
MGADLLLVAVPCCDLDRGDRSTVAKALINNLTDAECESLTDNACQWDEETPQEIRRRLLHVLDQYDEGWGRDVSDFKQEGADHTVLITGGMSWGDSPTDAYDEMRILLYFDALYDLLLKWAREDELSQKL